MSGQPGDTPVPIHRGKLVYLRPAERTDVPLFVRWLTDARSVVPGSTMPYRQADPDKRKLIIDYLKTLTP